jgi:hypothetical protein
VTEDVRKLMSRLVAGPFCAVAAVNYFDGELFDWAAYLGRGNMEQVAMYGEKIEPKISVMLFPELPAEKYRE